MNTRGVENELPPYDAVIIAGGGARRLGGVDKAMLVVGGRSLLDRATSAVAGATRVVLVGPHRRGAAVTITTSEQPPGSGPLAALAAGLRYVAAPTVVVLAADLPYVEARDVDRLRTELARHSISDAAIAVDDAGHQQHLLACWRVPALRRQVAAIASVGGLEGMALRRLTDRASVAPVRLAPRDGLAPEFDVDSPGDLAVAHTLLPNERDRAPAADERRT